jgi:REP element-mobilizing transposase RayT
MSTLLPHQGSHSVARIVAHVVWAVLDRSCGIDARHDAVLAELLRDAAHRVRARLLAAGTADDHVHVVVQHAPDVALAEVVRRLKGASSYGLRHAHDRGFAGWQAGYWAESADPRAVDDVLAYVRDQRARHTADVSLEPWQRC